MPAFLAALEGPSFVKRLRALKALAALGPRAAPAKEKIAAQLVDDGLRIHAISALGKIGPLASAMLPRLRRHATDPDEEVREAVFIALYRITKDGAEAALVLASLLATGSNPKARMRAACHLGEIGSPMALPVLVDAVGDEHPGVRQQAAFALGRMGEKAKAAIGVLSAALEQPHDDGVRFNAAVALGRIDPDTELGLEVLTEVLSPVGSLKVANGDSFLLAEKHPAQRAMAARALGERGGRASEAVPLLTECTRDSSAQVRRAAYEALERIALDADTDPSMP